MCVVEGADSVCKQKRRERERVRESVSEWWSGVDKYLHHKTLYLLRLELVNAAISLIACNQDYQ